MILFRPQVCDKIHENLKGELYICVMHSLVTGRLQSRFGLFLIGPKLLCTDLLFLSCYISTTIFIFFFYFSSLYWVYSFHLKFFSRIFDASINSLRSKFSGALIESWRITVLHQQILFCNLFAETLLELRPMLPKECRKPFHRCGFFCFLLFENSKTISIF